MTLTYNTEYWDGTDYDTEEYEIEVDDNIEDVEMFFKEYRLDPKEFIECALDDEDRYKKDGIEQMRESELYKYIYNNLYELYEITTWHGQHERDSFGKVGVADSYYHHAEIQW